MDIQVTEYELTMLYLGMCMNIHRYMQQQLMRKKEALNLKESQEAYVGGFTNEGMK